MSAGGAERARRTAEHCSGPALDRPAASRNEDSETAHWHLPFGGEYAARSVVDMSADGPTFDRPPVSEVALAAYFSAPLPLRSAELGRLWHAWRAQYPRTADHPPLPPVPRETFDARRSLTPTVQFLPRPWGTRSWFLSETGERLIQLQPDRLVLNWRRLQPGSPYPGYDVLRSVFAEAVQHVQEVVRGLGYEAVTFEQAEVSYTNPVPSAPNLAGLVAPWSGTYSDAFLAEPEDVEIAAHYRITPTDGPTPVGRLHVQVARARQISENTPEEVQLLQLFARGVPARGDLEAALQFLDVAHRWVVNGFRSFTTPAMHRAWGLREEEA